MQYMTKFLLACLAASVYALVHHTVKKKLKLRNKIVVLCVFNNDEISAFNENGDIITRFSNDIVIETKNGIPKKIIKVGKKHNNDLMDIRSETIKVLKLTEKDTVSSGYYGNLIAGTLLFMNEQIKKIYKKRFININIQVKLDIGDEEIELAMKTAIMENKTIKKLLNVTV